MPLNQSYTSLPYIKSLDGIRGLAAIMVVFFHSPVPAFRFQFGWAGVNLFFILSGFLITRILLNTKHQPFKLYLRNFYVRRALRIFPLYFFYLLLSVFFLFVIGSMFLNKDIPIHQGIADFKNNYAFLLTYTYNFEAVFNFFLEKSYTNSVFFGHLWTLSVEEQFYLIFPFAVYFLPTQILKKICLAFIVLIPILRLLFVLIAKSRINDLFWIGDVLYVSTIFQLDTLSLGDLLALFDLKSILKNARFYLAGLIIAMIIIGAVHLHLLKSYWMGTQYSSLGFDAPVYHLLTQTPNEIINNRYAYSIPLINFAFALLMALAINRKILTRFFENKVLVYLGKISYGIYICHLGLSFLLETYSIDVKNLNIFPLILLMFFYLSSLILISSVSYNFFEQKFLYLKDKFAQK